MHKRFVAPFLACLTLAIPASASAHARSATVALDYRLELDAATQSLDGIRVRILDGDRALRISSVTAPVVVLGDVGEPMLRIDRTGAWANRASVTALAQRLVAPGNGWRRVGGSTFAWHDHRLAPPPYDGGRAGRVAHFSVPIRLDGRRGALGGTFVRYRRPARWPWIAAALLGTAGSIALAQRSPRLRSPFTVVAGAVAGLAAVASLASFGVVDSPSGRVAWVQPALAILLALAAGTALVQLQGERRVVLAALIGAAAAATTLGSLGVFRHAVVISAVPAVAARLLCAVAFSAGVAAATTGLVLNGRRA